MGDTHSTGTPNVAELQRQLSEEQGRAAAAKARADEARQAVESQKDAGKKQMAEVALSAHETRQELSEVKIAALKEKIAAAEEAARQNAKPATAEEKRFAEVEAEAKAAKEEIATLKAAAQRREFAEQAKDWPGETAKHVSFMESLDDEGRRFYGEQQRAIAAQLAEADRIMASHLGVSATPAAHTAEGQLHAFAEGLRTSDPKLTKAQAYTRAMEQHPELYERSLTERAARA